MPSTVLTLLIMLGHKTSPKEPTLSTVAPLEVITRQRESTPSMVMHPLLITMLAITPHLDIMP